MPTIPRHELEFLIFDWLDTASLLRAPRFADHDREGLCQVIDTARAIAIDHFEPLAARLDTHEPRLDGHRVVLAPGIGEALDRFRDAGFYAGPFAAGDGGLDLPQVVHAAAAAVFTAACPSIHAYPFLTTAAASLLDVFATDDQRRRFMHPMVEGRIFGTMCLSEPQAGSSLADIRTRAEFVEGRTYRVTGDKMWISGADHDLAENIVHLVLARIPGAPPGVKGISLFAVPKYRILADGTRGAPNAVRVSGLNHKMGQRGIVNCAIVFGEGGECLGELIGEPHKGLACMFRMMNEARIGVGLGASAIAYAGFAYSLAYAKERRQGRSPLQKDPSTPPVRIIEHADVKRMLLAQKSYAEGALALSLYCAHLVDVERVAETAEARREAAQLLEVLTPIAKAWPSEYGNRANALAIQVLGGYGYARDYPVERYYRDNRINPIHEGTNGIQAIDLLGRKVPMEQGAPLRALLARMRATAAEARAHEPLAACATALDEAVSRVEGVVAAILPLAERGALDRYLANASAFLDVLGHTVVAWMWLGQATAASDRRGQRPLDAYRRGKVETCRYFFRWELPLTEPLARRIATGDVTTLEFAEEGF